LQDKQLLQLRETALRPLMGKAVEAKDESAPRSKASAYDSLFRSLGLDNRVAGPASKSMQRT
jgi:hypothetical protein